MCQPFDHGQGKWKASSCFNINKYSFKKLYYVVLISDYRNEFLFQPDLNSLGMVSVLLLPLSLLMTSENYMWCNRRKEETREKAKHSPGSKDWDFHIFLQLSIKAGLLLLTNGCSFSQPSTQSWHNLWPLPFTCVWRQTFTSHSPNPTA